ncbi:Hypothetical protein CpPa08_0510 [Corynebacterium pseudotuberculosis]|nr:Hypothetical protein CpN1_0528 [Corynebacterium pseudotuberculosis]ATQ64843.1 Hypothetical protein CpPA07_0527 [Corynebacterium pseudotuberculosis]ATQ80814.1 Hypothetical protein CpPa08_0510 [Corynebacterium pseudotuberculosis]QBI72480.1 Hypothetical protein Cp38MAT_0542 [Corynebacterium pseudotuberculosis]QBK59993.1 Hypothetical protein CpE7_0544 [Corynebacterium pseudotuberculosis]
MRGADVDNTYTRRFLLFIAAGTTLAVAIGILVWKLGSPQTTASNATSDAGPQKLEEAAVTSSASVAPQPQSSAPAPADSSPQEDPYVVRTQYPIAPNRVPHVRHDPLMPPNAHLGSGKPRPPTTTVAVPTTPQEQTTIAIPEIDTPTLDDPAEETPQNQSSQPHPPTVPVSEGSSANPAQSTEKPDQNTSSTSTEPSPAPTEIITEPTAPLVDPSTVQKMLGSAGTLLSPQEEPHPTAAKETEPKPEAPAQNTEKVVPQP